VLSCPLSPPTREISAVRVAQLVHRPSILQAPLLNSPTRFDLRVITAIRFDLLAYGVGRTRPAMPDGPGSKALDNYRRPSRPRCFFAAVDDARGSEPQGEAARVGGVHPHGVVPSRRELRRTKFGIHSASCAEALRRCPQTVFSCDTATRFTSSTRSDVWGYRTWVVPPLRGRDSRGYLDMARSPDVSLRAQGRRGRPLPPFALPRPSRAPSRLHVEVFSKIAELPSPSPGVLTVLPAVRTRRSWRPFDVAGSWSRAKAEERLLPQASRDRSLA